MQNDPEFDTKLEEALTSYADPVDAGNPHVLTARVLAAIEGARQKRRWWLSLAFAAPALACAPLILLWLQRPIRPVDQTIPAFHATLPTTSPMEAPRIKRVHMPVKRSKPERLPKLDQFPAPMPLTEQEQLLVQFATQAPPATQKLIAKTQQESDGPLRIAELTIPKLDSNSQPK